MDYRDMKNVAKTRIYRSIHPDLPIEEWTLVYEGKGADPQVNLSLKDQPRIPHYFRAQYVYKDGKLSGLSDPQCIHFDDSGHAVGGWNKKRPDAGGWKFEYRKPE